MVRRTILLVLGLLCVFSSVAGVGLVWGRWRKRSDNPPTAQPAWTDPALLRRSDPIHSITSRHFPPRHQAR